MTTNDIFYKYQDSTIIESIVEYRNLSMMWDSIVKKYAQNTAIEYLGTRYTYAQLDNEISNFRTLLLNENIHSGDTVAILADRSKDFIKALLAAITLNITVAVIPLHFDTSTITDFCEKNNIQLILFSKEFTSIIDKCKSQFKSLAIEETGTSPSPAVFDYSNKSDCLIMFTGGSLGKNKGALLSHECVLQGIINGCYGYNNVFEQKYLLALPMYHVFGLIRSVLHPLYTGSEIFINTDTSKFFEDMMSYEPTIIVMIPLLVQKGVNLSKEYHKNFFGSKLKTIITGAAPLSKTLCYECNDLGIKLCAGYGLTETACMVSGNPDMLNKPESVGLTFPNQEIKLVNNELWLKGPHLLTRYLDEEENSASFEDGWFKTGDIVRFDEDNFLYIVGRKKEMLLLENGENVYPSQVEMIFNSVPWIQESMLYQSVDENSHEILVLEVLPTNTKLSSEEKENMQEELNKINNTLPKFERAHKIIIRDKDFLRTSSMKIIRKHSEES